MYCRAESAVGKQAGLLYIGTHTLITIAANSMLLCKDLAPAHSLMLRAESLRITDVIGAALTLRVDC